MHLILPKFHNNVLCQPWFDQVEIGLFVNTMANIPMMIFVDVATFS